MKSVEMQHESMPESHPRDNEKLNVKNVKDLTRGYVASNSKNGSANFTAQMIIMNHPGQIGNSYAVCHTSHIAVISTKVDRRSGKGLEMELKILKNGNAGFVTMIPPIAVETFAEYSPMGGFALAEGGMKAVEKTT